MYDIGSLYEATTIPEALDLLTTHPDATLIAGGSDVLIKIHEVKMDGCTLVSIHGIKELEGVTLSPNGTLCIGPLTTFTTITNHPLIKQYIPMLGHAVDQIGGPQIRNVATIGGNISNGVTSADSASTLFTYNAKLEITGPNGKRILPIADYYKGPGKVDLALGEILTAILIEPQDYIGFHGHYIKYAMREAMDIATLGCAANCKIDLATHTLLDVRLAFGVAGPVPMRCPQTEAALKGDRLTQSLLTTAGALALLEVKPRDSWRASKAFRLQLVEELTKLALKEAISLGGGTIHD
ncbi:MAG: xanthine dehydrogenase subunit XdhB [Cellulosilyticaceae bacterium]